MQAVQDPPGLNPATCWPEGKPRFTVEYPMKYDLSEPKRSFQMVGKMVLDEMVEELPDLYELPEREVSWIRASLDSNVMGGKMNRGLIVVEAGAALLAHQDREVTNRDLCRFAVLGWATELLQACMLMADDIMDGSVTRRGQPCWYSREGVGTVAINDFLMIEMYVYKVLKRHFGQDPFLPWLIDLFQETTFQTECGQLLDSICEKVADKELTLNRWTLLAKYKTAFYSAYMPVALAMLATGIHEREAFDAARKVLVLMGLYFQAQDDVLDAFASPEVLGKIGTDIVTRKCSWVFAHANELASEDQKRLLFSHYGKCAVDSEGELAVKELYSQLKLQEVFSLYEEETMGRLQELRQEIEKAGLPWFIFEAFIAKIKGRSR